MRPLDLVDEANKANEPSLHFGTKCDGSLQGGMVRQVERNAPLPVPGQSPESRLLVMDLLRIQREQARSRLMTFEQQQQHQHQVHNGPLASMSISGHRRDQTKPPTSYPSASSELHQNTTFHYRNHVHTNHQQRPFLQTNLFPSKHIAYSTPEQRLHEGDMVSAPPSLANAMTMTQKEGATRPFKSINSLSSHKRSLQVPLSFATTRPVKKLEPRPYKFENSSQKRSPSRDVTVLTPDDAPPPKRLSTIASTTNAHARMQSQESQSMGNGEVSRHERKRQGLDQPSSKDLSLVKRLKRARDDEKEDSLRKVAQLKEQIQEMKKENQEVSSPQEPVSSSQTDPLCPWDTSETPVNEEDVPSKITGGTCTTKPLNELAQQPSRPVRSDNESLSCEVLALMVPSPSTGTVSASPSIDATTAMSQMEPMLPPGKAMYSSHQSLSGSEMDSFQESSSSPKMACTPLSIVDSSNKGSDPSSTRRSDLTTTLSPQPTQPSKSSHNQAIGGGVDTFQDTSPSTVTTPETRIVADSLIEDNFPSSPSDLNTTMMLQPTQPQEINDETDPLLTSPMFEVTPSQECSDDMDLLFLDPFSSSAVTIPRVSPSVASEEKSDDTKSSQPPNSSRKRCISDDVDALLTSPSASAVTESPSVDDVPIEDSCFNDDLQMGVPPSRIHQLCMMHAQTERIIKGIILMDPAGATRRIPCSNGSKQRKQSEFDYPINIALQHSASLTVLELLAAAGPSVMVEGDGPESRCTLSSALNKNRGLEVVAMLLVANPDQARMSDRHKNYPLHIACIKGSSFEVVKLLASLYPSALFEKNFHGQTPLDIAQRKLCCSDQVVTFLQQRSFGYLEESAIHLHEKVEEENSVR